MVMEAKPSPQSVGREFVRQYYTLLNKAPDHLHRFYNQSSSFIHGGLDSNNALVVGQKNIHDKIQQLGFRDCHAKISHVDAQATLGEGVVVQVSGELSNDGQPMRRFTQTFVLACQSPKKYYVHNDIFRYQDIYTEDEDSGRGEGLDEESEQTSVDSSNQSSVLIQQTPPQQQPQQTPQQGPQQGPVYYTAGVIAAPPQTILPNFVASPTTPATATQTQTAQVNGVAAHDDILKNISTQTSNLPSAEPTPVANAPAQTMTTIPVVSPQPVIPTMPIQVPEPVVDVQQVVPTAADPIIPVAVNTAPVYQVPPLRPPTAVIPAQPQPPQNVAVPLQPQPVEAADAIMVSQPPQPITYVAEVEVLAPEEGSDGGDIKDMNPMQEKTEQRTNESPPPSSASSANQPKTYANLFKQGSSGFSQNNDLSYNTQISPPQQQQQQQQQPPPQQNKYQPDGRDGNPDMQGGGRDAGGRPSTGSLRRDGQMQRQRTNTFNDSHQLFFGNVPHRATEDELREIFAKFGRVVDLRIHTKSTAKNPSSRPLPNYGFITFDDQQSVQNCLNAMPIWFPDANASHASKLNIEEKKRQNTPREGRRDGRDRDGPRNGNGAGGMNRGGSGNRGDRGDRDQREQRMGGSGGGGGNRPPFRQDRERGSIGPRTGERGSNGSNYNNNNNNRR